jgi:hypothetical protein
VKRALVALILVSACNSAPAPSARPERAERERTLLGITLGSTSVADAKAALAAAGVTCEDASMFAMMAKAHAHKNVKVPDVALDQAKRGEAPPAAAGMPSSHAKYLNDPALRQVRLSCENVPVDKLDATRAGVTGRLLVIADSDAAPITFIAYQRTYTDAQAAADDARTMFASLDARLGASGPAALAPDARLERYKPIKRAWTFPDLVIEARAIDLGATGISVSEELRVPR